MSYIYHNVKIKRPSGRTIQRHPNGEGSVLTFDMYGSKVNLYIPDAKYRDFTPRNILNSSNYNHQLHSAGYKYVFEDFYLLGSSKDSSQPFTDDEYLTDSQLQSHLNTALNNQSFKLDWTAKEGTDAILQYYPSSPACNYVRSLVPSGLRGCDIPNLYELSVIWLESDQIDTLDPTVKDYSDKRLGSPERFNSTYFWTCTGTKDSNSYNSYNLNQNGYLYGRDRYNKFGILPVLEL